MENKILKVILDTNLLISFIIKKTEGKFDSLLKENKIKILFSNAAWDEWIEVASRDYFRKYFSLNDLALFSKKILKYSSHIKVHSVVLACRDTKDNFLLALAKDSNADYLLSGDKDLLILKKFNNTKILTLSEFLKLFN